MSLQIAVSPSAFSSTGAPTTSVPLDAADTAGRDVRISIAASVSFSISFILYDLLWLLFLGFHLFVECSVELNQLFSWRHIHI